MTIVGAAKIFPVSAPPQVDGAVLVRDGVIIKVGPAESLRAECPAEPFLSFPDCVLMPGLVNTHCHLEYSALNHLARPSEFTAWIRELVRESFGKKDKGREYWEESAREGVLRSLAAGITCVGDVVTFGASPRAAAELGLRMRAFVEAVAVPSDQVAETVGRVGRALDALDRLPSTITPGISPHSVYTLCPEALEALAGLAVRRGVPMAVHVAETVHERELLEGRGPFRDQIRRFGLPFGPGFPHGLLACLDGAGILLPKTLLVHGVHLTLDDFAMAREAGAYLATCPRSNALLGAGSLDCQSVLAAGLPFAYGTDSLASVPDFDLFEEARMVRKNCPEEAAAVLRRMTLGGAEALGLGDVTGSVEAGKAADLILLRVNRPADAAEDDILREANRHRIAATMAGGRLVHEKR